MSTIIIKACFRRNHQGALLSDEIEQADSKQRECRPYVAAVGNTDMRSLSMRSLDTRSLDTHSLDKRFLDMRSLDMQTLG